MQYELHRDNGEVVILSEMELNNVYHSAKIAWNKDYVVDLLIWKGFDPESMEDEDIERITEKFIDNISDSEILGEIESETFDYTMKHDFPEYEKNEEEK